MKIQKKMGVEGLGRGGRVVEVRVDVNEELKFLGKFTKKNPGVRWGVGLVGVQGGFERRIEVFVKIQKQNWGGGRGWVRGGGRVGGGSGWM